MPSYWVRAELHDSVMQEWFAYAGYKARDAREPFREIAYTVIRPGIVEQFATEGRRLYTEGWKPLSESYAKYKAKDGYGEKPILQRKGAMKDAMESWTAFRVHQHNLSYEPVVPDYAHWHQTGGYVEGQPPQRKIVDITTDDEIEIQYIFEKWLDDLRFDNRRRPNAAGGISLFPGFSVLS